MRANSKSRIGCPKIHDHFREKMTLIVFEGIDATGKTTLAKYLSSRNGYYIKSPSSNRFLKAREHFDDIFKKDIQKENILERFFYYTAATLHTAWVIENKINHYSKIIVDRYYYSTIVYHEIFSPGITNSYLSIFKKIRQPDLVFYIYTSYDILRKRLKKRDINIKLNDLIILNNESHFNKLDSLYRDYLPSNTVILENNESLESIKERLIEKYENFF